MSKTGAEEQVMGWWFSLQEDKAARAELRRCATLSDTFMIQRVHKLLERIENRKLHDPAIVLAIILAHLDKDSNSGPSFAKVLGREKSKDQRLLSNLRFGSLLQALVKRDDNWEPVVRNLRRAIKIAKGQNFNVRRLIGDILFFSEQTQRNWTYDYWQTTHDDANAGEPAQKSEPTTA
jgi:CRISPR system Cascade subunit CasB